MSKTFDLKIVASDRDFFEGKSEMIILPAIDGNHGVMAQHESMVTAIQSGEVRFQVDGEWKIAALGDGFAEIMPDYVVVVVDTAEWPEEIDVRRAEEAKERAEERLRSKQALMEYYHSKAALSRAMTRLKVTKKVR
ncbi:MAG: ATP synthase F1 subunit epsilon [Anaerovorax sp.]|nr:ATP synthase F1 subunit epsilon [Anaerovorax sp.]